jgi:hypothetical protein
MKKTETLNQLENLCGALSIIVKYDKFFGQGGYCRLRDRSYFIINERLSNEAKEQIFINELKTFSFDNITVPEKLRELFKKQ